MSAKPDLKVLTNKNSKPYTAQAFKQAEGHEIPLASAKRHRKLMKFVMMNGDAICAYVFGFDRYTITVEDDDGRPVTIYKHGIFSFCEA